MGSNIKTITYDLFVHQAVGYVAITIFSWITDAPLFQEIQFTDVLVLYDKDTGQIRDAHYVGNMGSAKPTTQHQNEQRAQSSIPKVAYRVDLNTKQLAVVSLFSKIMFGTMGRYLRPQLRNDGESYLDFMFGASLHLKKDQLVCKRTSDFTLWQYIEVLIA